MNLTNSNSEENVIRRSEFTSEKFFEALMEMEGLHVDESARLESPISIKWLLSNGLFPVLIGEQMLQYWLPEYRGRSSKVEVIIRDFNLSVECLQRQGIAYKLLSSDIGRYAEVQTLDLVNYESSSSLLLAYTEASSDRGQFYFNLIVGLIAPDLMIILTFLRNANSELADLSAIFRIPHLVQLSAISRRIKEMKKLDLIDQSTIDALMTFCETATSD